MARKIKQGTANYNYQKQADVKAKGWEGEEGIVHSDPLMDSGTGARVIIRKFDFAVPVGVQLPPKDQLLAFNRSKIISFLWMDELELIKDLKIEIAKNRKHFRIFATCMAKKGSIIYEKPQTLQQITQPHETRNNR